MEQEKFPLHQNILPTQRKIERVAAFPDVITLLHRKELGRQIIMMDEIQEEDDEEKLYQSTELQYQIFTSIKPIGYILPLKKNNLQHLFLFSSGEMLVTKPQSEQSLGKSHYIEMCEPSIEPFVYVKDAPWENTEHAISWLRSGSVEPLQVVIANDLLIHGRQFKKYSTQAIKLAEEMKTEREAMRDQSFDIWLPLLTESQTNEHNEE